MNPVNKEVKPQLELPKFTPEDYAQGIERYLETGEAQKTLRPHQMDVFSDFQEFFAKDYRRGFVAMPTGTGKTVLFVELSKAILHTKNAEGYSPRILVASPLKDLVHQTLGSQEDQVDERKRGYGGFAPNLKVGTYFSDSSVDEKMQEGLMDTSVVLTTYKSIQKLRKTPLLRRMTPDEINNNRKVLLTDTILRNGPSFDNFSTEFARLFNQLDEEELTSHGRSLLELFNVTIFDEAHNVMGGQAADLLEDRVMDDMKVIGFTASPKADAKRTVKKHLPKEIHSLSLKESVEMELLAPLVAVGVSSSDKIIGDDGDIIDDSGDYIEEKLGYLAQSDRRNSIIAKLAKTFVSEGIGTVINCISGNDAWHPEHVAEILRVQGIAAQAIHHRIPSHERSEHYKAFERGELDVLTYIGILAEGWDSQRAKALINGRPTRSRIVAIQRLGRILRPGGLAYAVDLVDRTDTVNPTYSIADIFEDGDIPVGEVKGRVSSEQQTEVDTMIRKIGHVAAMRQKLRADHNRFDSVLVNYPDIANGELLESHNGTFRIASKISSRYKGLNEKVIESVAEQQGIELDIRMGNRNSTLIKTYNQRDILAMLEQLPVTDPQQYFVDGRGNWIAAEGSAQLFSKTYPELTGEQINELFLRLEPVVSTQYVKTVINEAFGAGPVPKGRNKLIQVFLVDEHFIEAAKEHLKDIVKK